MSETETETPTEEPNPDAEPETPIEGDDDEEGEAEEPQTLAQAATADGSSDVPKKIERAVNDQRKRLSRILGVDLAGSECPACGGMGYTTGATEDVLEFREDPGKEACPTCNGLGQLISHSKAPGHELVTCVECAGQGWRMKQQQPSNVTPISPAAPSAQAAQMGQLLPDGRFLPFGATEPITLGAGS